MTESDSGDIAPSTSARKRVRTVSNLTEEQIQHKRNVDRRAQRAFRQRTKDCISKLEEQFGQLQETCCEKEQELQSVREHNKALLQCLETVIDLVSSTVGQFRDDANTTVIPGSCSHALHAKVGHLRDGTHPPGTEKITGAEQTASMSPYLSSHDGHVTGRVSFETGNATYQVSPAASGRSEDSHNAQPGSHQLPVSTSDVSSFSLLDVQIAQSAMPEPHTEPFAAMPTPCSTAMANTPPYVPQIATVLPSHFPSTCPLDEILLDFLSSRRDMLSKGVSLESVAGPEKPTVKALFTAELATPVHPLSGIMSRVLSTFPCVGEPEKLAFFYLMCQTMRWQISPTKENYFAMPTWLRPTVTQIAVPHAIWIDNIPWPSVRDVLIENADKYPFEVFSEQYSQRVTVNWPFDVLDAVSDLDNEAVLHSIFEKHIRNLKNWTVSAEFRGCFPEVASLISSCE
ncbi:hypothetical protein QBC33DRAFT_572924 [Phialemonium atrogriseum]|uniref:BZIP domain-containing protein n=1 Tax=Phialemonium atrogriseum TaxID=1093897 RepID=A0AAJ0BU13_9PEZI|nr:uncharacterized protein QBC33DRAFT_572924 [Phialemonium atrogriseum]KAK1763982.1 hypothetical protein QBC33DRAFT_572924 [Phialemonium atrogriseum]